MKVLIVGNIQSVHVQRWAAQLEERGIEVVCVSFSGDPSIKIRHFAVGGTFPGNLFRAVRLCWKVIREERPDVMHSHYLSSYGLVGALTFFKPFLVSAWGSDLLITARKNRINRWLIRFVLRRASMVFADSLQLMACAREIGQCKVPTERVLWGIDRDRYPQASIFTSRKARKFVSIRMHEPIYNIATLIHCFAKAKANMPDATLYVAGSGELTPSLRQLCRTLKVESSVIFTGKLNEVGIAQLLRECDVSISIPLSDGTAMSVLESMAAGLPMICTDLPANREWLDQNGAVFVDTFDDGKLMQAFQDFYNGAYDLAAMGARNRAIIDREPTRQQHFNRVVKIYANLSGVNAGAVTQPSPETRSRNVTPTLAPTVGDASVLTRVESVLAQDRQRV